MTTDITKSKQQEKKLKNILKKDFEDIRFQAHVEVNPVLASEESIRKAIEQYYGETLLIRETVKGLDAGFLWYRAL